MVIQRLQSLFLLIASVLMLLFIFVIPVATVHSGDTVTTVYVKDIIELLVINAIVAILLFVSIFLFKNIKMQIKVTLCTIMLLVVGMATGTFILSNNMPEGTEITWVGSAIITVFALLFALAAWNRMRRDYKTLRDYDRLR